MTRILFPIDGSEYATSTLEWASCFLQRQQSELFLLIVSESLDIDYSIEGMKQILADAETLLKNRGFQVINSDYITNQKAAEAICWYADSHGIEQIILGSHGRGFARLIIGSISQEVMQKAKQPVLVLQNTKLSPIEITQPEQINLSHWTEGSLVTLLPVDNPYSAELAMEMMRELLSQQEQVYLLYVIPKLSKELTVDSQIIHEANALLSANRYTLERNGCHVLKSEYRIGRPAEQICQYADEHRVNQIVMASRNRSNIEKFLMGSVSAAVFKTAKQPVLVFSLGPKTVLSISHSQQLGLIEDK